MLEVENPQGLRQKRVSSWLGKEKIKQETRNKDTASSSSYPENWYGLECRLFIKDC